MQTTAELEALPTIRVKHNAHLKIEEFGCRVWLAKEGDENGEPYPNTIYIEYLHGDKWITRHIYNGDEVESVNA